MNNLSKGDTLDTQVVKLKRLTFGYQNYDFFSVEKVYLDGESNGEYHIKLTDNSSPKNAVLFFSMHLKDCEIGMVDPILNLDYPIYIKAKGNIDDVFTVLNGKIESFRKAEMHGH